MNEGMNVHIIFLGTVLTISLGEYGLHICTNGFRRTHSETLVSWMGYYERGTCIYLHRYAFEQESHRRPNVCRDQFSMSCWVGVVVGFNFGICIINIYIE